jgi:hypothetical protein
MGKTLEVRIVCPTDLEALVRLATAFRDHHELVEPPEEDFWTSIVRLLQHGETSSFSGCDGTSVGYVQSRYRYSAWTSAFEAEIEDVFGAMQRGGMGSGGSSWGLPLHGQWPKGTVPSV